MHELGIVFHVIDEVKRIAEENDVSRVLSVTVGIGEVSLVIPSYFEDCWKWAAGKQELLRDAAIVMETLPAVTRCLDCGQTYPTVKHGKICPFCGSGRTVLESGNEFILKEIRAAD